MDVLPDISNNVGPVKSFFNALLRSLLRVAGVIIHTYNDRVRLLSPEPLVVKQPQFTRVEEPTLLCNQVPGVIDSQLFTCKDEAPQGDLL